MSAGSARKNSTVKPVISSRTYEIGDESIDRKHDGLYIEGSKKKAVKASFFVSKGACLKPVPDMGQTINY